MNNSQTKDLEDRRCNLLNRLLCIESEPMNPEVTRNVKNAWYAVRIVNVFLYEYKNDHTNGDLKERIYELTNLLLEQEANLDRTTNIF